MLRRELLLQNCSGAKWAGLITGAGIPPSKTAAERWAAWVGPLRPPAQHVHSLQLRAVCGTWMHAHSVGVPVRALVFGPSPPLMLASIITALLASATSSV
jgi:hypothetical protein